MAGRRPKPSALKLVQGNPGKRALPKDEPKPEVSLPEPPAHLSPVALQAWNKYGTHLVAMGVMTRPDGMAFEMLVMAYADYRRLVEKVGDQEVYECETKEGGVMLRANPLVAMRDHAWTRVARMLGEFGLTPATRSKVSAGGGEKADPFDQFLAGHPG